MKINFQIFKNNINRLPLNNSASSTIVNYAQNPFLVNRENSLKLNTLKYDTFQISFGEKHCSESNFKIKDLKNLRCPACGQIMLTNEQIEDFSNDIANKKGAELVKAFEKYEDDSIFTNKQDEEKISIYRPIKQKVINVIKTLALENPEMSLIELVKLQAQKSINALIDKQMEVIDELNEYIQYNIEDKNELITLNQAIKEYKAQIEGKSEELFSRKRFIYGVKIKVNDEEKRKEIEQIASKMPTSENNVDSFFVKYANKELTSKELARRFVFESIPTAEHILPQSKGGADKLSNYLCDCADCNSRRGDLDFHLWAKTLPGFERRLQQYFITIQKYIDNDYFDENYNDYCAKVIKTIRTQSKGNISLEVPVSSNPSKAKEELIKRKRQVEKLRKDFELLVQRRDELDNEIKSIENNKEIYDKINIYQRLKTIYEIFKAQKAQNCKDLALANIKISENEKRIKRFKRIIYSATDEKKIQNCTLALNAANEAIQAYKQKLEYCQAKALIIQQKIEKVERIILPKKQEFSSIDSKMKELNYVLDRLSSLYNQIEENKKVISKEDEKKQKLLEVNSKIDILSQENGKIESREDFDCNDDSDYEKYKYNNILLSTANSLLSFKKQKISSLNSNYIRDLISISKNIVQDTVNDLKDKDSVVYFLNCAKLKSLEKERNEIQLFLNKVEAYKKQNIELKNKYDEILNGSTREEIKREYSELKMEKKAIDNTFNLDSKKEQLKTLDKSIQNASKQLKKLQNYEELSNNDYNNILSRINFENI